MREQTLAGALRDKTFNAAELFKKCAEDDLDCVDAQVKAGSVYMHVGRRAPPPGGFEKAKQHRARMLRELARYSGDPKRATLRYETLPEPTLKVMEDQIYGEVLARADAILVDARPGEIMKREKVAPVSGRNRLCGQAPGRSRAMDGGMRRAGDGRHAYVSLNSDENIRFNSRRVELMRLRECDKSAQSGARIYSM